MQRTLPDPWLDDHFQRTLATGDPGKPAMQISAVEFAEIYKIYYYDTTRTSAISQREEISLAFYLAENYELFFDSNGVPNLEAIDQIILATRAQYPGYMHNSSQYETAIILANQIQYQMLHNQQYLTDQELKMLEDYTKSSLQQQLIQLQAQIEAANQAELQQVELYAAINDVHDHYKEFFRQNINRSNAETEMKGKTPGSFLIRFSESEPDSLVVSYVDAYNNILHTQFKYNYGSHLWENPHPQAVIKNIDQMVQHVHQIADQHRQLQQTTASTQQAQKQLHEQQLRQLHMQRLKRTAAPKRPKQKTFEEQEKEIRLDTAKKRASHDKSIFEKMKKRYRDLNKKQNKQVLVVSTQSPTLENFGTTAPGHTGLAYAHATGGGYTVMRTDKSVFSEESATKHVSSGGLLIITGHGSVAGSETSGQYHRMVRDETGKIVSKIIDIERTPKDFVSAALNAGLSRGDHINILLSACYGAAESYPGAGDSFAHKIAKAFSEAGISTTIVGSVEPVDRRAFQATPTIEFGAEAKDLRVLETRRDGEKYTTTVSTTDQKLLLTDKGMVNPKGEYFLPQEQRLSWLIQVEKELKNRFKPTIFSHHTDAKKTMRAELNQLIGHFKAAKVLPPQEAMLQQINQCLGKYKQQRYQVEEKEQQVSVVRRTR